MNTLTSVDQSKIEEWVEQFDRDGFLFFPDFLPSGLVAELKADLENSLDDSVAPNKNKMRLRPCMFEVSRANLSLFDYEPVVSFAEAVLGDNCHVMHNNSFQTFPQGGLSKWHQDDPPIIWLRMVNPRPM